MKERRSSDFRTSLFRITRTGSQRSFASNRRVLTPALFWGRRTSSRGGMLGLLLAKEFEMPNVYEIIRDHVSLSISCIDRIYVNGYIATLQVPGQLCLFMR